MTAAPGASPDVTLKERLRIERKNLEDALESLYKQCEPVAPQRRCGIYQLFCGNTEDTTSLAATAQIREILYKSVAKALRCYAAIADQLGEAGYTPAQSTHIKQHIENYVRLREMIQQASGEYIDLKPTSLTCAA
jgi:type I restriction enzyme R subunit